MTFIQNLINANGGHLDGKKYKELLCNAYNYLFTERKREKEREWLIK